MHHYYIWLPSAFRPQAILHPKSSPRMTTCLHAQQMLCMMTSAYRSYPAGSVIRFPQKNEVQQHSRPLIPCLYTSPSQSQPHAAHAFTRSTIIVLDALPLACSVACSTTAYGTPYAVEVPGHSSIKPRQLRTTHNSDHQRPVCLTMYTVRC